MAKGKKKGGKVKKEIDPNAVTEVDKTFYELQIKDLNKKLARLRELNQELELKNEEVTMEKDKLDEDRNDIIIYLKRILQEKTDEVVELEERIVAMRETRVMETKMYTEKIAQMKIDYKQMHEQLTAENKLSEGKVNSLEEFRSQRDELMRKFESQEAAMEQQEDKHKRQIYEIEKKFILSKEQLKQDVSTKLFQLSSEFNDATELRIAATTHRVIRENIAVNNELDVLLNQQQLLYSQNANLKKKDHTLRNQNDLLVKENKMTLAKVGVQLKLIERLTDDNQYMVDKIEKYKLYETEVLATRKQIKELNDKVRKLEFTKRILEQNLHHVRCDRTSIQTDFLNLQEENERLSEIMLEAVSAIKEALTVRRESEMAIKASKREKLLNSLLTLLNKVKDKKVRCLSLDTVSLFEATYAKGDLGFVPKPVELRPIIPIKRNMDTQTSASFEEYIATGEIAKAKMQFSTSSELLNVLGKEVTDEYIGEEEKNRSNRFYDDQEDIDEEESFGVYGYIEEEELEPVKETGALEEENTEFLEGEQSEFQEDEETDMQEEEEMQFEEETELDLENQI